jgi:uncharacterized protein
MALEGIVTNVADFGAFVDIGVHQDGLVHVSQLADHFVSDPKQIVKVGQVVNVRVLEVNEKLKRISLSMRVDTAEGEGRTQSNPAPLKANPAQPKVNSSQPKVNLAQPKVNSSQPKVNPAQPKAASEKPATLDDLKAKFGKKR